MHVIYFVCKANYHASYLLSLFQVHVILCFMTGNYTKLQCQANGRWSKQKAFCHVRCDPLRLDADNNGKLKTLDCAEQEQEVGQPCKIRCSEGYHVEGEKIKKLVLSYCLLMSYLRKEFTIICVCRNRLPMTKVNSKSICKITSNLNLSSCCRYALQHIVPNVLLQTPLTLFLENISCGSISISPSGVYTCTCTMYIEHLVQTTA